MRDRCRRDSTTDRPAALRTTDPSLFLCLSNSSLSLSLLITPSPSDQILLCVLPPPFLLNHPLPAGFSSFGVSRSSLTLLLFFTLSPLFSYISLFRISLSLSPFIFFSGILCSIFLLRFYFPFIIFLFSFFLPFYSHFTVKEQ